MGLLSPARVNEQRLRLFAQIIAVKCWFTHLLDDRNSRAVYRQRASYVFVLGRSEVWGADLSCVFFDIAVTF
jgi:hypothetical protein